MRPAFLFSVSVLLAAALVMGCASSDESTEPTETPREVPVQAVPTDLRTPADMSPPDDTVLTGVGRVQYVNLEGGFYGIIDDESERRLDPQNLDEDLQIDGLQIQYRARVRNDVMTMRMWGTPVELLAAERLD